MNALLLSKIYDVKKRYNKIKSILEKSKNIITNYRDFRSFSKEYSRLTEILTFYDNWKKNNKEILSTKELLVDREFFDIAEEELHKLLSKKKDLEIRLKSLLCTSEDDEKGCFIEIRSATGGNEASLFAKVLFRMYSRYACIKRWKLNLLSCHYGDLGGYKEVIGKISNAGSYNMLKFESGGHRVQRVPETESQGRVHTSSCTVAIIPEVSKHDSLVINPNDLRIDTFRSSGAGGQHVNTTDSAIRIMHIPTGIVVECQNERSQHKNKSRAQEVLFARLIDMRNRKRLQEESVMRRSLLGSGNRSDRIRTYNFPSSRVTDHRIGLTVFKLEDIIDGNLDLLIPFLLEKLSINE